MQKRRKFKMVYVRMASVAVAASVMPASVRATLLVDNITGNSFTYYAGAGVTADTYVGGAYILPTGTTQLTGVDLDAVNGTNVYLAPGYNFSSVQINAYFWGTVNLSTATAANPAFSNLLAEYSTNISFSGTFNAGYYLPIQAATAGTSPGLTFGTPLNLPTGTTTIGITYNIQGELSGSTTFASYPGLTTYISYGGPPAAGSEYTAFYLNTGGETNGNFIEGPYTFNRTDNALATRIYGTANTTDLWTNPAGGAWETSSNWSVGVPGSGTDAKFNLSSAAPGYTVSLSAADTAKDLIIQNDNVSLSTSNVFASLAVTNSITVGNASTGSLTLVNSNGTSGGTPSNFSAGSVYVGGYGGNTGTGLLVVTSTANLISTGAVTIGAGSALNISGGKLYAPSLSLAGTVGAWTGKIDLGTGSLDLSTATLATVTSQAKQGYAGGTWNANGGITSTAAATDTAHLTAVGVISNNLATNQAYLGANAPTGTLYGANGSLGTFEGLNPGNNDVLVKYTYYGDCLLQGSVTGTDYSIIDNTYLAEKFVRGLATTSISGWANGDFNYDGVVNGSDYTLMDNAFNQQGQSLGPDVTRSTGLPLVNLGSGDDAVASLIGDEQPTALNSLGPVSAVAELDPQVGSPTAQVAGGSAVPEPTSLGLLGFGAVGLLARRRRR